MILMANHFPESLHTEKLLSQLLLVDIFHQSLY